MNILLSNLVTDLNNLDIGEKIKSELENRLGDLREYGLEERQISAVAEAVAWKIMSQTEELKKHNFTMKPKNSRTFFDGNIGTLPIDFKYSKCAVSDNLSAQGAILYVLCGDEEHSEQNKRLSGKYIHRFDNLYQKALINRTDQDFGYLILDKNTHKFSYATLRTLAKVSVNQSNFLQSKWSDNIDHCINRTLEEWVDWIYPQILSFKGYKELR
jgi:hypothetical protein